MQEYRKRDKPSLVVEAVQLTEDNVDEVANWSKAQIVEEKDAITHESFGEGLNLRTPAGTRRASRGWYVIKFGDDFFVSPPVKFEDNYEVVTS